MINILISIINDNIIDINIISFNIVLSWWSLLGYFKCIFLLALILSYLFFYSIISWSFYCQFTDQIW